MEHKMKIKAVLFDLDGTLLPMDQDLFIKAYLGGLVSVLAPRGYDPKMIAGALIKSTDAMIANDGAKTNEEVFWDSFSAILGDSVRGEEDNLRGFYEGDFQKVKGVCGYNPEAKKLVDRLNELGLTVVLATNPLFPAIATESRIRWAGLSPEDFALYTTYESSRYCKPNTKYYEAILSHLGLSAEECIMVGNDVGDDMVAKRLGMQVFLLTDDLINKSGEDINNYPHGDFMRLSEFIDEVLNENQ